MCGFLVFILFFLFFLGGGLNLQRKEAGEEMGESKLKFVSNIECNYELIKIVLY